MYHVKSLVWIRSFDVPVNVEENLEDLEKFEDGKLLLYLFKC